MADQSVRLAGARARTRRARAETRWWPVAALSHRPSLILLVRECGGRAILLLCLAREGRNQHHALCRQRSGWRDVLGRQRRRLCGGRTGRQAEADAGGAARVRSERTGQTEAVKSGYELNCLSSPRRRGPSLKLKRGFPLSRK